jgi:hypothetical protein
MNNQERLEKAKSERLNKVNFTKEGYEIKIVEYYSNRNIIIEFQDEHKTKIKTTFQHFEEGNIKNPFYKSIYGIGYIGIGEYKTYSNSKETLVYRFWKSMMSRCYNPYYINKELTYKDCFVCEEWHCFQNFAKWYEENYYEILNEKMDLDKDILFKGNKIYSPQTCIFVPKRINNLFTKGDKTRGEYPIGVYLQKATLKNRRKEDVLVAQCCTVNKDGKRKQKYLGSFPINRPFQAFYSYKVFKEQYIKQIADEYEDLIPRKLYEAMYKYKVEIND